MLKEHITINPDLGIQRKVSKEVMLELRYKGWMGDMEESRRREHKSHMLLEGNHS